jgi:predicted molibdopterin-dependent oxidoreductase YjgC
MTRIADSAKSQRGAPVTIIVDGAPLPAFVGETIAGALLASGGRAWRHTRHGQPRGMFCGIGVCFDCLVTVNGTPKVRACLTPVAEGMTVQTQETTP